MKENKWAVEISWLESPYSGDGKWHKHTTRYYEDKNKAWDEADKFAGKEQLQGKVWYECKRSLLRKRG